MPKSLSMGYNRIIFIFFSIFICQLFTVDAESTYVTGACVIDYGNYTQNSTYQQNLNLVFSNLSSQASVVKFKNLTVGENLDIVYGLFQCRQDLSLDVCSGCIKNAAQKIVQKCPVEREAVVWYYECMLRFANRPIFSFHENNPSIDQWVNSNISSEFSQTLAKTMDGLITQAASFGKLGHFATQNVNLTFPNKLYCLAQCTSDIDDFECNSCLRAALAELGTRCPTGCIRAMAFLPSCHLRYDVSLFYNETNLVSLAPQPSKTNENTGKQLKTVIIVGSVVGVSVVLLLLIFVILRKQKLPKETSGEIPADSVPKGSCDVKRDGADHSFGDVEFVQYDFATLKAATRDFSKDNKLGEGSFGAVYKGTLVGGEEVAIKRSSGQSDVDADQFMTEARIVAKLQHRNLVKLVGFCSEGVEKLLVYEFMSNKSLDCFLFGPKIPAPLIWETRYNIIMGTARGLQYLHEDSRLTIIHRDLKAANILLDGEMDPKIADFGTAKTFQGKQKEGNTCRVMGTFEYMAPEYIQTGEYSNKSDVYSFGIIVLELVSGRKNRISPKEYLPIHAWNFWKAGQSLEFMDTTLGTKYSESEVMRCIQIGLLCVQGNAEDRPTMTVVVLMLTGSITLPSPSSPGVPYPQFNIPTPELDQSPSETDVLLPNSGNWHAEIEQDLYPR